MNFLQHLDCFIRGGKITALSEKALETHKAVTYTEIPDEPEFFEFTPINEIIGVDRKLASLEFIKDAELPKEEAETPLKLKIFKLRLDIQGVLKRVVTPRYLTSEEQVKEVYDEYLAELYNTYIGRHPRFTSEIADPDNLIRNGIFHSYLKKLGDYSPYYVIDLSNTAKYSFKTPAPTLKAYYEYTNGKLKSVRIDQHVAMHQEVHWSKFFTATNWSQTPRILECLPGTREFEVATKLLYSHLFCDLTINHLILCHMQAGTYLSTAIRGLRGENPVKQFFWNSVYKTLSINQIGFSTLLHPTGGVFFKFGLDSQGVLDYIDDFASKSNKDTLCPTFDNPLDSELINDKQAVYDIMHTHITKLLAVVPKKYKIEIAYMFDFLRGKMPEYKDVSDASILANLMWLVSVQHEIVGNSTFEVLGMRHTFPWSYDESGVDKYEYISTMLTTLYTSVPVRKIVTLDVELTLQDSAAKKIYQAMVADLLDYEKTISPSNDYVTRVVPSNLEAGVQV